MLIICGRNKKKIFDSSVILDDEWSSKIRRKSQINEADYCREACQRKNRANIFHTINQSIFAIAIFRAISSDMQRELVSQVKRTLFSFISRHCYILKYIIYIYELELVQLLNWQQMSRFLFVSVINEWMVALHASYASGFFSTCYVCLYHALTW